MFVFDSQLYFPILLFFSSFCLERTYLCVFENNLIFEICICLLSRFFSLLPFSFLPKVFYPCFFLTPSPGTTQWTTDRTENHRTAGPEAPKCCAQGLHFSRKRVFFHGMHLFFNVVPVFAMRSEFQMSSFKNGDTKS